MYVDLDTAIDRYLEKWRRENPQTNDLEFETREGPRGVWFVGSLACCVPLFRAHPGLELAPAGSDEGYELGLGCGDWLGARYG